MRGSAFPFVLASDQPENATHPPLLDRHLLPPPAALAPCIREIAWVRNNAARLDIPPTSGALLAFRLSGHVTTAQQAIAPVSVTGLQTHARRYDYQGETVSLLIRLTPQGSHLLGLPARDLVDRIVDADALPHARPLAELHTRLLASKTPSDALTAVQTVLATLPFTPDPLIEHARPALSEHAPSIAAIASHLGLSERQLERRFLQAVGVSPKRFASLLRFERALPLINSQSPLAQVATEAGYADQPHLSREVSRFTGMSPGLLRERQRRSL